MEDEKLEQALKDKCKSLKLDTNDEQIKGLVDFIQVCLVLQRYTILEDIKKVVA